MNYLHNIPVRLHDNPLTEDPNDLYARIVTNKTLDIRSIANSVRDRAGAAVSAETIEQCVRLWLEEAFYRACDGFNINADWLSFALHIKGAFNGARDHFDPERHRVVCEFLENARLRKYIDDNVGIVVEGMADETAYIDSVKDSATGSINGDITVGGAIIVTGAKIKLAGDNPAVGVYLTQQSDGAEHKVAAAQIVENNPSKLILLVPAQFAAGVAMRLSVKTQYSNSNNYSLKEPRTVTFDKLLTTRAAQ